MKRSNSTSRTGSKAVKERCSYMPSAMQKSREEVRAHISENLRQSFCAEGVCYSKAEWNRISQKLHRKK